MIVTAVNMITVLLGWPMFFVTLGLGIRAKEQKESVACLAVAGVVFIPAMAGLWQLMQGTVL